MSNATIDNDTSLRFLKRHKSIKEFTALSIPPFTVITGLNGSGKTHLLEAIRDGQIETQFNINEIQYYSFATMVPNDAGMTNSKDINSATTQIINWIRQTEAELEKHLDEVIKKYDLQLGYDKWSLLNVSDEALAILIGLPNNNSPINDLMRLKLHFHNALINNHGHQPDWNHALDILQQRTNRYSLAGLTQTEIRRLPYGWRGTNIFQQSFAQIFYAYFDKYRANQFKKIALDEGKAVEDYLEGENFKKVHGEPPWIFVNQLLSQAKLPFRITFPEDPETTDFMPLLVDQTTGENYPFSSLSSGEKILISFAICLYHSNDKRQYVPKPKLLLLDEIDASLHPAMCRQLIEVITQSIVKEQEVNVIMTTHSPSTIAMCPEENIYLMRRGEGLLQTSKNLALSTLTAGIPTLSINYAGRRQVFTEDKSDAFNYEKIYQLHKHIIASERSLEFIPVANSKIEVSGCAQVKSIVKSLNNSDNRSVFGIIDWDKQNKTEGNIIVISEDVHYSIENILLDPVIIAAALLREKGADKIDMGLSIPLSYNAFIQSENSILQTASDHIQKSVLGDSFGKEIVAIAYVNGQTRNVDREYLSKQAHKLEKRVLEVFKPLNRYSEGKLLRFIVENILPDAPHLTPQCLLDSFRIILDKD